ncbi:MAG: class I SAM-dependent methyltransferase [Candidatus Rokubacteria bacterium]|nr:class I SAM-dependent methyltransferase [Candidatus Rokubacteria bacterium]
MAPRRITLDTRQIEPARFAGRRILEPEIRDDEDPAAGEAGAGDSRVERTERAFVRSVARRAPPNARLLDVGAGGGAIAVRLALERPDLTIVAVDLSDAMLRAARRRVREAGLHRRVRVRKANSRKLPFPGRSFDMIISNALLHHLPDPTPSFDEMARLLTSGGSVFIRDLRRPGPSRMAAHIRRHGRSYGGRMRRLFADSVRASFKVSEMREIVESSRLAGCKVRPQHEAYLVVEGVPRLRRA